MKSTNKHRVSARALATLGMIAGLTGSGYGQTPTVSIEAVHSKAAPGIADATWKVTVSSAPTAALEIDLDFTYNPGIGTNYLGTSGSITIPANSTSASKDFPLDAYTRYRERHGNGDGRDCNRVHHCGQPQQRSKHQRQCSKPVGTDRPRCRPDLDRGRVEGVHNHLDHRKRLAGAKTEPHIRREAIHRNSVAGRLPAPPRTNHRD